MNYTVCIPTYKRPHYLQATLASLLAIADPKMERLIIAITGPQEDSFSEPCVQLVAALSRLCPVSVVDQFSGLTKAIEYFIDQTKYKTDAMLILDDDVIVNANYLKLSSWFYDPNIGAVAGTSITPVNNRGYQQWSAEAILVRSNVHVCNTLKKTVDCYIDKQDCYQVVPVVNEYGRTHTPFNCEYLMGSALFVRPSLMTVDHEFGKSNYGGHEVDSTYSIFKRGYRLIYDPSVSFTHLSALDGGCQGIKDKNVNNWKYLFDKWGL